MAVAGSVAADARALRAGLVVKAKLIARRARAEREKGAARLFGLLLFGAGSGALVFALAYAGGWYVVQKDAPDLARTGASGLLLGISAALVLSSLGHAASAFFSAKDLWFWDASPARPWARFVDRATETAISSLPMPVLMGSLGMSGLVLGVGGGVAAVARGLLALTAAAIVPLCLGVLLAHVGGALLPAGKLRRWSLFVLGVGAAVALVWLRRARVEKILTPEGAAEMLADAKGVTSLGPAWLPPNRGAAFVIDGDLVALAWLLAFVVVVAAAAWAAHALLFRRARDLAVDESPTGLAPGSARERLLRAALTPVPRRLRPVVEKDLLSFARDPSQWGQLILLVGVGALYLVNADALFQGFQEQPKWAVTILAGMHTGLVTFVAAGLGARFAFPQMGLEGPAVWIADGAPLDARDLVVAKWIGSLPVVGVFPTIVAAAGGFVLQLPASLFVMTTALVAVCATALAAYAVGRGAISPVFDAANTSELAVGPGAISSMITSVAVAGFASVCAAIGGAMVYRGGVLGAVLVCALPALVATMLGAAAIRRGARAFVQRREEEAARDFHRPKNA